MFVIASTLSEGSAGAANSASASAGFPATCVACFASAGGPSSCGAGVVAVGGTAAALAAAPSDFAADPSDLELGTIAVVTPGFTTLAGGPAGAESCLTASVSVGAATICFGLGAAVVFDVGEDDASYRERTYQPPPATTTSTAMTMDIISHGRRGSIGQSRLISGRGSEMRCVVGGGVSSTIALRPDGVSATRRANEFVNGLGACASGAGS